ncbi:NACHT domain-containing protein [Dactylosporangium sp. NPDC005555]|uniref:NACHT domain-containing protein n=1 Tax=Dactylosporangium sp. NPDC005555 TaxID=3154889 RepID=UPI0033A6609F
MERDIATFMDPGTTLESRAEGDGVILRWQSYGNVEQILLRVEGNALRVQHRGRWVPYAEFLGELADLRNLANNMARTIPSAEAEPYVEAEASYASEDSQTAYRQSAKVLVDDLAKPSGSGTRVVFITGDAGAGKTRMLEELTRRTANDYLAGSSAYLYLNVNAQGRGLARLNEALATELQDLRAKLTYHSVARLVRVGKLRLIVDGFDELIGGQGSYEEAFGSLAGFIEELNGSGSVVAAARSVYYEQEFLTRANSSSELGVLTWQLVPVEMISWDKEQRDSYIDQVSTLRRLTRKDAASLHDSVVSALTEADKAEQGLLNKPLFVAATCDLILDNELREGGSLLERLVAGYVQREVTQKLIGHDGPMLTTEQYDQLLEEFAIEMWRQRARELNRTTIREIVSLFAQVHGLAETVQENLVDAASSRAMLRKGSKPNTISFEHDLFFSHYLGTYVAQAVKRGARDIRSLLRRANLPIEAARSAVRRLEISRAVAPAMLDLLVAARDSDDPFSPMADQNAGVIAAEVVRAVSGSPGDRLRINGFTFGDADLVQLKAERVDFSDSNFIQSDLRGASFDDCTFESGFFSNVVIDGKTKIATAIDVSLFQGLRVASPAGMAQLYDPLGIADALRKHGATLKGEGPVIRQVPEGVVATVEKAARYFSRSNLLRDKHDDGPEFTKDSAWDLIVNAAVESKLLRQETRAAAGNSNLFYRRLFRPEELMAGLNPTSPVSPSIREFWEILSI